MKNLCRRAAAVLLCVVLSFGIYLPKRAEGAIKNIPIDRAEYAFLEALGIVDAEDRLDTEVYLTRGILVKTALKMAAIEEEPNDTISQFDDLPTGSAYCGAAAAAYNAGLLSGGSARMSDYATIEETAKILALAMGYGIKCEKRGGWPNGYIAVCTELGILPKKSENNILTADFIHSVAEALEKPVMKIDSLFSPSGEASYVQDKDETLLSAVHGIKIAEGVVETDKHTSLYGEKSNYTDEIIINGKSIDAKGVKVSGILGKYAQAYYKSANGIDSLVYIREKKGRNTTEIIKSFDITDISADGMSLTYEVSDNKSKEIEFNRSTVFIYNFKPTGVSKELFSFKRTSAGKEIRLSGDITLIDNNTDGKYEVVIIRAYDMMRVQTVSERENRIIGSDGNILELVPGDGKYTSEIYYDGEVATISDIKQDDILLFAKSSGNRKDYLEIVMSRNCVEATVKCTDNEKIMVGEEWFFTSSDVRKKVYAGFYGKFYTDAYGTILSCDEISKNVFGYLKASGVTNKFRSEARMKIFTEKNRWVELTFAQNVKVNGERKTEKEMYDYVKSGGYSEPGLISYSVNSDGKINKIDTAEKLTENWNDYEFSMMDSEKFRLSYELNNSKFRSNSMSFEDNFIVGGKTKIFFIPYEADASDEDYMIAQTNQLVADREYPVVCAYNVDRGGTAEVLVMTVKKAQTGDTSGLLTVAGTPCSVDTNGEWSNSLSLFYGTEKITIPIKTGVSNDAQRGDVVQITIDNASGKISSVTKRYDAASGYEQKGVIGEVYSSTSIFKGKILSTDANAMSVVLDYGDKKGIISASSCKVYIYNTEENTIKQGDFKDLYPSRYCIMKASYLRAGECIVFE